MRCPPRPGAQGAHIRPSPPSHRTFAPCPSPLQPTTTSTMALRMLKAALAAAMAAALVGLACGEGMRARCRRVSPAGARRGSGAPRPSGVLGCPASGAGRPRRGAGEQRAGGSHRRLHSSLRRSRRALVPVSHARGAETVRTPEHFPGRARGPRGRARRTRICARMSRSACRRSGSPQLDLALRHGQHLRLWLHGTAPPPAPRCRRPTISPPLVATAADAVVPEAPGRQLAQLGQIK